MPGMSGAKAVPNQEISEATASEHINEDATVKKYAANGYPFHGKGNPGIGCAGAGLFFYGAINKVSSRE